MLITFKNNQEIIAKTICIEKETLDNNCQGKCHLTKQLKKIINNNGEENSNTIDSEKLELLYTLPLLFDLKLNSIAFVRKNPIIFIYRKTKTFSQLVFHPPII